MRILVLNKMGQKEEIECSFVPRIGDQIPLFYSPYPIVEDVVVVIKGRSIQGFNADNFDAVIIVK